MTYMPFRSVEMVPGWCPNTFRLPEGVTFALLPSSETSPITTASPRLPRVTTQWPHGCIPTAPGVHIHVPHQLQLQLSIECNLSKAPAISSCSWAVQAGPALEGRTHHSALSHPNYPAQAWLHRGHRPHCVVLRKALPKTQRDAFFLP